MGSSTNTAVASAAGIRRRLVNSNKNTMGITSVETAAAAAATPCASQNTESQAPTMESNLHQSSHSSLDTCLSSMVSHSAWRLRLANAFMSCMFGYSATMQLNDPDWLVWFMGYAIYACICAMLAIEPYTLRCLRTRRVLRPMLAANLPVIAVALAAVFHSNGGAVDFSPDTEVGREALGLCIVGIWMFACACVDVASVNVGDDVGIAAVSNSWLIIEWGVLIFAALMLIAPVLVPWLLEDASDMGEGHCTGMGPFQ